MSSNENPEPMVENMESGMQNLETGGTTTATPPPALPNGAKPSAVDPFFSGRKHYPELDGLRALAIIAVILLHFAQPISAREIASSGLIVSALLKLFHHGAWGVELFFALSGYLITGILLQSRGQQHYFRNFYARRTLRIFPLYYGTLLALLAIVPLVLGRVPEMLSLAYHKQIWLWTYTCNIDEAFRGGAVFGNFVHFWSLAIEEQFYLVWPLVIFLCPPRWVLRLSVAGIVLVNIARVLFLIISHDGSSWNVLWSLTPFRADALLVGAAVAAIQFHGELVRYRAVFINIFMFAACLIAGCIIARPHGPAGVRAMFLAHITLAPLLFGAGIGYLLTCQPGSWLVRALSVKPLRAIGKYSYAMYVFHLIYLPIEVRYLPYSLFAKLLHNALLGLVVYYLSAIAIAFGVAFMSYHLYEKHFLKLKKYFPEKTAAAGTAGI